MAADLHLPLASALDVTPEAANVAVAQHATPHAKELPELHIFTELPATDTGSDSTGGPLASALLPLTSIPLLNSFAGAAVSLYLDFNGHFDSVWGAYKNVVTPVFDQDGDATTFSDAELTTIQNVWAQVAEDFSPFNINVTTVEPTSFANGTALRVAIGGDGMWLGGGAGGVAYVNSFTNSIVNTVYVFPKALANGFAKYVGEAVSHEAGHGFGLDHQSLFTSTGAIIEDYNPGSSARAPIMGNSYSSTRGLWWAGSDSTNRYQDDMSILARGANGFGYRADDHANGADSATALVISDNKFSGSGVIHTMTDVDYFSFDTGPGEVSFTVDVPAGINNLDARLELRDAFGTLLASAAPINSFGATISGTMTVGGSYRLVVASQGNYGDVGQYTISGSVAPAVEATILAPTQLAVTIVAGGVSLTWSDNATNETAFYVERRTSDGSWTRIVTLNADATSYTDGSAAAGGNYEYRVQAANDVDVSGFSNVVSVTLAPAAPANLTAAAVSGTRVDLAWADVAGESGYKVERLSGGVWTQIGTTAANVVTYADTTAAPGASYQYRVRAVNAGGDSALSNVVSVATPAIVTRPAAPSNAQAFVNSNRQVQLSWRDNSSNEKLFVVQRSTNGYNWTTLGSVPANSTSAIDLSAARSRVYYYRVLGHNDAGYSGASNIARIITPSYLSTASAARSAAVTAVGTPMIQPMARGATTSQSGSQADRNKGAERHAAANGSVHSAKEKLPHNSVKASSEGEALSEANQWRSAIDTIFADLRSLTVLRR